MHDLSSRLSVLPILFGRTEPFLKTLGKLRRPHLVQTEAYRDSPCRRETLPTTRCFTTRRRFISRTAQPTITAKNTAVRTLPHELLRSRRTVS